MTKTLAPRRLLAATATLAATALLAAGCSQGADAATDDSTGKVTVVASTDVYGSLAEQVGGDDVSVTSLIHSASQDPHSYEASARDKLALKDADVTISNGGGYDDFFTQLQDSVGGDPASIVATDLDPTYKKQAAGGGEANEHVWYRFSTVSAVVDKIADDLAEAEPDKADTFRDNAKSLTQKIDGLGEEAKAIAADAKGKKYLMTEPVPQALLDAAGLSDGTPEGLSEAVEEGDDISPATLDAALKALKAKQVAVFAYNAQTSDDQTEQLRSAAESAGVPVVDFTETLPEGVSDYVAWMHSNLDALGQGLTR